MAASNARSYMMVAEAAAEIVSQKLEILLSDPVCVGCLSMETLVKDTKGKLAVIQELLSPQHLQSETTEWWERLVQAMYHAEEFIDKFHFREARERHKALHMATRPLTALISKYMLWRDLSHLVNDMNELCQDKFLTGKKEAEGKRNKEPASVPWQDEKSVRLSNFWHRQEWRNYLCRMETKEEIMKWIKEKKDSGLEGISILGEQGVGKTFLARWLYREARNCFKWHAWVSFSTGMGQREFLLGILKQVENLPTEKEDMDINEIAKMLYKKSSTQTFLIVLDDVHESKPLLQVLGNFIHGRSAGCIITTTQDARIARIMNSFHAGPIKLENLRDEQSQTMLVMKLHGVAHAQRLTQEENNILKRSPPLPLCISLLGGLMSNAGEQEHTALSKDSCMMTLLDILQLSYNRLPVHLKPCFIYMALFPVASAIRTRRLVRLWLAEGLLDAHCYDGERKGTRTPEEVGETFLLELADRNVIDVVSWRADGSPKACHMLTSLYDMIHSIVMHARFLHVHATSESSDVNGERQQPAAQRQETKVRWLAEHTNIVRDCRGGSLPGLNLGHVRSFLSFCLRRGVLTKDISTVLRNMTSKTDYCLLRVLDLEGVYKPSLQRVLHKLVLLKYLGLRSTVLDSIPSAVADLQYLETLDIKDTNITSLPNSFWKARNLRHLHLNWLCINLYDILKACSKYDMALTKLQTLSGLVIGEVSEDLMKDHGDSLTTLTKLKLFLQHLGQDTSGAVGNRVANWISSRLTNLQSLTLGVFEKKPTKLFKSTTWIGPIPELSLAKQHNHLLELYLLGQLKKPSWTELLPRSLRVLTLSGSKVKVDLMPELGGLLRNLRTFRLLANSFLSIKLTFAGFPSLMILKIWKLPQLTKVTIEKGAMPHLKELEFRRLERLEAVEGIHHCTELESICEVVKKGAQFFVDHLKDNLGERTYLYKTVDTEAPESTDDRRNEDEGASP